MEQKVRYMRPSVRARSSSVVGFGGWLFSDGQGLEVAEESVFQGLVFGGGLFAGLFGF